MAHKIIKLEAENVKGVRAISITPDGMPTIFVGGENEAGKSSLLDSIEMALRGAKAIPGKPIRDGQDKARIVADMGDIIITRTFDQNGTKLVIKGNNGATFPSPQKMLDTMIGKKSFDPDEFARQGEKEQVNTLKEISGLNFDDIDKDRAEAYELRTTENRDVKRLQGVLDSSPARPDVPDEPISIEALSGELEALIEHNQECDEQKAILERRKESQSVSDASILRHTERVETLAKEAEKAKESLAKAKLESATVADEISELQAEVDTLEYADIDKIRQQISKAEETNAAIRSNQERKKIEEQLQAAQKRSDELTTQIESLDKKKSDAIAKADFPVDGLGFDENGVTFKGIPFGQCSQAVKLRVSVAIGLSLNPDIRIILIRDGSHLGKDNLKLIQDMAIEADAQVWIERVGDGKEITVYIEDGMVRPSQD